MARPLQISFRDQSLPLDAYAMLGLTYLWNYSISLPIINKLNFAIKHSLLFALSGIVPECMLYKILGKNLSDLVEHKIKYLIQLHHTKGSSDFTRAILTIMRYNIGDSTIREVLQKAYRDVYQQIPITILYAFYIVYNHLDKGKKLFTIEYSKHEDDRKYLGNTKDPVYVYRFNGNLFNFYTIFNPYKNPKDLSKLIQKVTHIIKQHKNDGINNDIITALEYAFKRLRLPAIITPQITPEIQETLNTTKEELTPQNNIAANNKILVQNKTEISHNTPSQDNILCRRRKILKEAKKQ